MPRTIQQTVDFEGVEPRELFDLYLDADAHARAIGAPVTVGPRVGAPFAAFGRGKVRGKNLALVSGRMIVQSWRGEVWDDADLDSVLVLTFTASARGTRLDLVQSPVPDEAFEVIRDGWSERYWEPWKAFLAQGRG